MKSLFAVFSLLAFALAQAQAPPPAITQLSWTDPIYPGSQIFIDGSGFTNATQVKVGAAIDASFIVDSDTHIRANMPIDAIPGGLVSVTTAAGTGISVASLVVVKYPPPPGPACLPNTGNVNTALNPSTGNTIVTLWCDVAAGTYHYMVAGSATAANFTDATCLANAPPFTVSLQWVQAAWAVCLYGPMSNSDQAVAERLAYAFVPRPTIKGTGPQTIFTTAKNGGLGSPLILGTPQAFQTIAGGLAVGGLRLPGGNVTRYCDVSTVKSDQGNVIPAGSYAACTLVFPPAGGFKYPPSLDKATISAVTDNVLIDAGHHVWGIDSHSIIVVDGSEDKTSANVVQLAYVGGLMWQRNGNNLWWSKTDPSAAWLPAAGTPTAPL